ncbi:hypothetical protein H5154_21705 [Pseudoalteromonas sp. SR44-5]|nr:hypothetical protein [Pseudoalteromonas sp. SR41-6]MBB1344258.1 hypothetical protein [Pseudoalteromonas sp. SR45-6]MBB1368958.1 hypothetical protein [Pseudoalteromonas sp. SR44-5]MBB1419886.1 hypothetical protein [Pseudoalteromonas sp. SG44-1]MBB1436788.1 hypothetical protein [Pseudoalteromonas sp. SG43-6]MBB1461569.1 hypothetical protein [Pseudoalteromonas sp. SG41-8]MBB1471209.1 hypothetical protein [Pseudoalteromonas sp. SG41-5]MBB1480495.1 hypothetical protein [Pseudoalteromonas sp. S
MAYYIELFIHGLTNLFIIVILFWFFFWDCERHNAIRRYFIPKVYRPFAWIGLNVEWTMFTPDPPMRDMWPMVVFTHEDGSKSNWEPIPYNELKIWEKLKYKKVLKFYFQVTANKADKQIKRDFIEYIQRTYKSRVKRTKIELFRIVRDTPPIEAQSEILEAKKELIFTFHPYLGED